MSREKQVKALLDEVTLDDSFVVGFYGGGNFGDELLFEVLQHTFMKRGYKTISFLYQKPQGFSQLHKDLDYEPIDSSDKLSILKTVWRRKSLVIGGGGLWGLDTNLNVVLMSVGMFFARFFMGKQVYLLGVGYYGSTGNMGHIAAWLAGKSATQILARDKETYERFSGINSQTYLSDDIAFSLPEFEMIDLDREVERLEGHVGPITAQATLISVRRFKPHQANSYQKAIETWLTNNPEHPVIMALMEPREVDPDGYALLKSWQQKRPNMKVIDFDYNPITLYRFFMRHRANLSYIGPQFHVLLVAHLAGVRIMPVAYDNKVVQLLEKLGHTNWTAIQDVSSQHIQQFLGEGTR